MEREHRFVVVGDGDVGAATAYRLARAVGARVLVLDAGAGGGTAAEGDALARADLAHPDDARTALAPAAHRAWRDLERLSGQTLLTTSPGVVVADRARPEVGRYTAVADRHGLDFAVLDARGLTRRWPQFSPAPHDHAFVQARGGILASGRAAAVHRLLAAGHGAVFRPDAPVRALHATDGHVEVVLDDTVLHAEHVVVAAGTGTATLLAGPAFPLPLVERAEVTARHAPARLLDFCPTRFPVFSWHGAVDVTGFGAHGGVATRLVDHRPVPDDDRRAFLAAHLPGFAATQPEPARTRTRAEPADGLPALGPVPGAPRVGVAVGTGRDPLFAGVAGAALADLALTGRTRAPVAPFAPGRRAPDRAAARDAAARPR